MGITLGFSEGYADVCYRAMRRAGYSIAFAHLPPHLFRVTASRRTSELPTVVSVGRTKGEALHRACLQAGVTLG